MKKSEVDELSMDGLTKESSAKMEIRCNYPFDLYLMSNEDIMYLIKKSDFKILLKKLRAFIYYGNASNHMII